MIHTVSICDGCEGLFGGAEPFTVLVIKRGKDVVTEYCSAVCGLKAIKAIPITVDFKGLSIELIGAYDLAAFQKALKGSK